MSINYQREVETQPAKAVKAIAEYVERMIGEHDLNPVVQEEREAWIQDITALLELTVRPSEAGTQLLGAK
jgi:hypothetical protein